MRNDKIYFFFLALFLILNLSACKNKKSIIQEKESGEKSNTMLLWEKINQNNFDFEWYHAKAKSQVQFDGMTLGGKADIRIKKDSAIWISLSKFGFELARVLIKPDSISALSRLESSYMAIPYDSLKSLYDIPFDFGELQEIVVGNQVYRDQLPISSMEKEYGFLLKSIGPEMTISFDIDKQFQISSGKYLDNGGRSLELFLESYQEFDQVIMPVRRHYYYPSKQDQEYSLLFELEKVELNEAKRMRFEIPKNYSEM